MNAIAQLQSSTDSAMDGLLLHGFADEVYEEAQKLLFEVSGMHFDRFLRLVELNVRRVLAQLRGFEALLAFLDGEEDEVASETRFEAECCLFSMRKVLRVMRRCVEDKCMSVVHQARVKAIEMRIEGVLRGLRFVRIRDEEWMLESVVEQRDSTINTTTT